MKLIEVIPPHIPVFPRLVDGLVESYEQDLPVTPVVLLGRYALCGSHRIGAARKVYISEKDIQELGWIILDPNTFWEKVEKSSAPLFVKRKIRNFLNNYPRPRNKVKFPEMLKYFGPFLPLQAQEALSDQDGFRSDYWWENDCSFKRTIDTSESVETQQRVVSHFPGLKFKIDFSKSKRMS